MKRILSLTLCLMITALFFVSCKNESNTDDSKETTINDSQQLNNETIQNEATEQTPGDTSETVDPDYVSNLPENLTYNNRTINILATNQQPSKDEFYTEGITGDLVGDAVYLRNRNVEERLGIKLNIILTPSTDVYAVGNAIRNSVSSGDKSYDISTMPGYTHTSYVLGGNYYNLLDVENLNLDKHYWTQGFNDIMNNGRQQFMATGAFSMSMYRNMYVTLYNRNLFDKYGLEDLYDIVKRGEWTLDCQSEMIKNIYEDLNTDSRRDGQDMYGLVTGASTSIDPYWVSLNSPILYVRDGEYKVELDREKMSDIVSRVQELIFHNEGAYCVGKSRDEDGSDSTHIIAHFCGKRAAMCTTVIYHIENYLTPNNFDDDYGIVPMPKYDKTQENYRTHVQDQLSVMGIVSTVDPESLAMMGTVMEAIASESYKIIYPAYYEKALSYRYLQDEESKEMLDLINKSIQIEGAFIYSGKFAMLGTLRQIISSESNRFASTSKMYMQKWEKSARELNEGLELLNH